MKFCFCVAEYNPLHNGHLKHIEYIKKELNAEHIIVIMSGNFTQRGEPAVLNKYERAKQAITAGASLVIELPTVFATANAEVFAKGAIKTANSLGVEAGICFGVESGEKDEYLKLARLLSQESKEYKATLKKYLDSGVSLAKAKCETIKELYPEDNFENLLSKPNNVLGVEYTKAILQTESKLLEIFPMQRFGDHNDKTLKKGITSATSIREKLKQGKIKAVKNNLPKFVYKSLKPYPNTFEDIIMSSLILANAKDMENLADCSEGLENRLKALSKDNLNLNDLIEKATTKRYTSSRIKRLLIANLLGITKTLVQDALKEKLYAKILAVKESEKDLISLLTKTATVPLLTRKSCVVNLKKTAKDCFSKDVLALELFNLINKEKNNEFHTLFV